MCFFRHGEIYRSDVRPRQDMEQLTLSLLPALIGFDEFPVGYSLAGCPPAEPASALPTRNYSPQPKAVVQFIFRRVCSVTFLNEATRPGILIVAHQYPDITAQSVVDACATGYRSQTSARKH